MKKTLAILTLAVVVCSCVFAASSVSASFDPFSLQKFTQKADNDKEKVNSKYGLGAGVGYNYAFDNGILVGGEVKFDTYYIKDQKNFKDLLFLAKAGYVYNLEDNIDLYADMECGLDLQMHDDKTSAVFEFGPEVGCSYQINDDFSVFLDVEFLFGFPKKDKVNYSEFRVTPTLGVSYSF